MALHRDLTSDDLEYIELRNISPAAIELGQWQVRGGVDLDIPAGTMLAPGGMLLVISFDPQAPENATRLAALRAHYGLPDTVMLRGGYQGQLSDGGEVIRLQRPGDALPRTPKTCARAGGRGVLRRSRPVAHSGRGTGQIANAPAELSCLGQFARRLGRRRSLAGQVRLCCQPSG